MEKGVVARKISSVFKEGDIYLLTGRGVFPLS